MTNKQKAIERIMDLAADYSIRKGLNEIIDEYFPTPSLPEVMGKMEEALRQIEQMSDCGDAAIAVVRMKAIATKALTDQNKSS